MPVSDAARKAVIEASGGLCEIFHDTPIEGSMIVHPRHQGMGGASEDSPCNDPNVLLYGCFACHDLVDGRSKHAPLVIARFDRRERLLDIMDIERRPIPHEQIFFHQWPLWKAAIDEYPQLVDALRRRNEAEFDLAKSLAFFRPGKGPELFRVNQEIKEMGTKADFRTFLTLIGVTFSEATELMPIGDWLNTEDMSSARGIDINAIDALRKAPDEEVERLLGLAERLPDFWKAVEEMRGKKSGKRSHYMTHDPKTGELEDIGLHAATPDIEKAFNLIRGHTVRPASEENYDAI